jgi:DNA-binding PadR family transcriptional regulator
MARKKTATSTAEASVKVTFHPDGSVAAIEGPASLVIRYRDRLNKRLGARPERSRGEDGAGASVADLPAFFQRVGPRRGEDVLTVAYFLNRRVGIPDFDRPELSHAIARTNGPKKRVNAATIYGLLAKGELVKTRRGRYAISDSGAEIVERRAGGLVDGASSSVDLRALSGWLGKVKRVRGSLIPTFAYFNETQAGLATSTRADLNAAYVAIGKDRRVAPATLARLVEEGTFDRAERGRYRLTRKGREWVEDLIRQGRFRRKRGPRRRRGPERIELPELRGASSYLRAFDLGKSMTGRAWKLALAAGYFLERHADPKLDSWKRAHIEAVFNRARGMEPPRHLSVLLTGKLAKEKLIESTGRRGHFHLTKKGRETVESQPMFEEAVSAS